MNSLLNERCFFYPIGYCLESGGQRSLLLLDNYRFYREGSIFDKSTVGIPPFFFSNLCRNYISHSTCVSFDSLAYRPCKVKTKTRLITITLVITFALYLLSPTIISIAYAYVKTIYACASQKKKNTMHVMVVMKK